MSTPQAVDTSPSDRVPIERFPDPPPTVLVVDDEPVLVSALQRLLGRAGAKVIGLPNGLEVMRVIEEEEIEVALLDIKMPHISGLELLPAIKQAAPEVEVIMMTANATVASAVQAVKNGAYDYLQKPFPNIDEVVAVVRRALERGRLARRNRELEDVLESRDTFEGLVGQSEGIRKVFDLIETVAYSSSTVLLRGESGTGKELVARALHARSSRADKPFIAINCTAMPETLLESELFGHEKGSFTGAIGRKAGRFELADGGTLFLDEIGEIPPQTQVKLLRVLQERSFERVGGTQTLSVDVRVLAATNRDLEEMVAAGRYRDDLYYRLNVVTIHAPALRDRRADIPLLWEHFVRKYQEIEGKEQVSTDPEVLLCLFAYDWPGNVRELENVAEHAVVMGRGARLTRDNLPARISGQDPSKDPLAIRVPGMTMAEIERAAILRTFEAMEHSTRRTAEALGISVRKIQYRLKEYRAQGFLTGSAESEA